jgi:hypothetical protein
VERPHAAGGGPRGRSAGAYAMAVARTPAGTAVAGPPTLAVDAPRLPTAAIWHDYFGSIRPSRPGCCIPAVPASFVLQPTMSASTWRPRPMPPRIRRELAVSWEPLAGGAGAQPGDRPTARPAPVPTAGVGLRQRVPAGPPVAAHRLGPGPLRPSCTTSARRNATSPLIPRADLTDPQRWRVLGDNVQPLADGLKMFGSPTTKKSEAGGVGGRRADSPAGDRGRGPGAGAGHGFRV